MVSGVNNSATPNVPANGTYQPPNVGAADAGTDTVKSPATEPEPAAILDVSARGRELAALQLRYSDPANPFFKLDASPETRAQSKANFAKALLDGPEEWRQIHTVAEEGTLNRLVQDVVNAKMDPATASKFTTELSRLIQGTYDTFGNPNETLEERVVNREKGLKLAEYIAENYIDDPADKQKFLEGVKHFANNAELSDKGYLVMEGPQEKILNPDQFSTGTSAPILDNAWNAAVKSIKTTQFADEESMRKALNDEYFKILINDPTNKGIAEKYNAGEIDRETATRQIRFLAVFGNVNGPSFGNPNKTAEKPDAPAVNEKAVTDTIAQVKSKIDLNAIMEDVRNIIKKITANFVSYDDYINRFLEQKPVAPSGHLL